MQQRNSDGSGQLAFAITREMFDYVETLWEPPSAAEMDAHSGVRVSQT